MKYEIIFTDSFKRHLKNRSWRWSCFKHKDDLKPLLLSIEEGECPGDPIPGLLDKVYKARCASSDMKRGKSGGYRVIYHLEEQGNKIYLLTIYSKAERENIPVNEILQILKEMGLN